MVNWQGPWGAYPNGPDYPTHTQQWDALIQLLGKPPGFQLSYVFEAEPISNWINQSGWASGVYAGSAAKNAQPIIGFPLFSTAQGAGGVSAQLDQMANGQHDDTVRGVLTRWRDAGYNTQIWRIGWEMNLNGVPWFVGDRPEDWERWKKAFRHIATVMREHAQQQGMQLQTTWNPGVTSWSNSGRADETLWPGGDVVDIVDIDQYNFLWPSGLPNPFDWTQRKHIPLREWMQNPVNRRYHWEWPGANEWDLHGNNPGNRAFGPHTAIELCKRENKPLAWSEVGVMDNHDRDTTVPDDYEFPKWLAEFLVNTVDVPVHHLVFWDAGVIENAAMDGVWSLPNTKLPRVQREYIAGFKTAGNGGGNPEPPPPPPPEPPPPDPNPEPPPPSPSGGTVNLDIRSSPGVRVTVTYNGGRSRALDGE